MLIERLDWSDEYKLLLVWYLLTEQQSERTLLRSSKYGKDFFADNFFFFDNYGVFDRFGIYLSIERFLKDGLIQAAYFEYDEFDEKKDTPIVKKVFYTNFNEVSIFNKKKYLENLGSYLAPRCVVESSFLMNYFLQMNTANCEKFIDSYLLRWSSNRHAHPKNSNMKAAKQLQRTLKQIYTLLKDSAPTNLILERPRNCNYDFVASVLYLEKIGGLKVTNLNFDPSFQDRFAFRVDVLDRFFGLFPYDKVTSERVMDLLFTPSKVQNRIIFNPPSTFLYCDKQYQMRAGAPLQLIELVKEEGRVAEARFVQVLDGKKITYDLPDVYERLRSILRKKLGFSSDERFFKVEEGMIIFSDLFDFHTYKKALKGV